MLHLRPKISRIVQLVALLAVSGAAPAFAQSIPIARADVDHDCFVTRADATIVQGLMGRRLGEPGYNPDADVNSDGIINNVDATFVARNLGAQVCTTPPLTIAASVSPAANVNGWNNSDVTISFTCSNATSCPAPVILSTEGAGQIVERTVSSSAGATATARVTVNIDKTPPVLAAMLPAAVLPGATVPMPLTVNDALSGMARTTLIVRRAVADSKTASPFTLSWAVPADATVGLQETLEIIAEDRAGNTVSVHRSVLIDKSDTVAPTVAVRAPATAAPGATVPVVVQAAANRALTRVLLTRSDGTTTVPVQDTTTPPFSFQAITTIPSGLADGTVVTFAATATDGAGNVGTGSATVRVVTAVQTAELQVRVDPPVSPTFQANGVITGTIGRNTGTAPPPAPPIVASVSPQVGRQGQTVDVAITGINTGFTSLSQVTFGPGLTVTAVSPTDATHLTARVVIDANASLGPRLIAVSTGNREAFLASAFSVIAGTGTVSGRLLNAQGQGIANAQVCLPSTTTCVTTGADGRFTFNNVPVDANRIFVSAPGYDAAILPLGLKPNGAVALGDVTLAASNVPPPPPPPNSPPVTPKLASALGRGATEFAPGGNALQLRALIRDSIVAVGGKELGVLDENGAQLNPLMAGAGYASFTNDGVEELADDMIAGDTISLAELFKIFMGSIKFPSSVELPTLAQLIAGFQDSANQAWSNPSRPESPLLMMVFNQGRVVSAMPPQINFDTRFNALQKNLLASSFVIFVNRYLNNPTPISQRTETAPAVAFAQPRVGFVDRLRAMALLINPRLSNAASARGAWLMPRTVPSNPRLPGRLAGAIGGRHEPAAQGSTPPPTNPYLPDNAPASRPPSLMWQAVMEKVLPAGGFTVARNAGSLCDDFLVYVAGRAGGIDGKSPAGIAAAKDPTAKFLPAPGCKDAISLLEILAAGRSSIYTAASAQFTKFLGSEQATRFNAARLQQTFRSSSYQAAWTEAKKEAATQATNSKLRTFARGFAEGYITKLQGEVVDTIFKLETDLFIQSIRPRSPFLVSVEQIIDTDQTPAGPSHIVKITFDRSPNDAGIYDTPDITWVYELYRGRNGAVQPVQRRQFRKAQKQISFYDRVPEDGTYVYSVRGLRIIGQPLKQDPNPPGTPTFFDKTIKFLAGFLPTSVSIAGQQVIGLGVVQTVADPLATIYRGINVQVSDFTDPQPIYVSTQPPQPRPPASLAVHAYSGAAFLSIPLVGNIFRIDNGVPSVFANANFKEPGQAGLAIDIRGDLYTDNSASDAQFGGRIFKFRREDGARTLAGSTNYYSMLIQYANPVSVQSLLVASGPYGEQLFIADSLNQRITAMTLPWNLAPGVTPERNISQPYAQSPLFQFGPGTAMAMRPDLTLGVTQINTVMLVSPFGSLVRPLFTDSGGDAPSPYSQLSGITFDVYGNMYVSDAVLGTISMIPLDRSGALAGLKGLSAIDRKKLTVLRGSRRPSDIKLSSNRDGISFYDGERAFASLNFGMAGQVRNGAGGAPIPNAQVYVASLRKLAVTDADGVFVLPELVQQGQSPIVDYTVRVNGRTHSYRAVLDTYKHNIVDVVFDPPPPVPPGPLPPPSIDPPTAQPPKPQPSGPETVSVIFDLQTTPQSAPEACPRGVFLAPAFGAGSLTPSTIATGLLTTTRFNSALLIVNGVASAVSVTDQQFSTTAALKVGENVMSIALPASALKPLGCADPTLDDAAPVSISTTHKVFHDPRPDELERYRKTVGFDLAVRGVVREGGRAIAGLGFHVPGTDYTGTSDGDGAFQVNLPKGTLGGATGAADAVAGQLFTRIGSIVALLQNQRRAEALDALTSLLLQATATTDTPPAAGVSVDTLLAAILQVQGTAQRLVQALQSPDGIPDPADIDALAALGTQIAAATSNGQIVVRGREYPELSVTVRVQ